MNVFQVSIEAGQGNSLTKGCWAKASEKELLELATGRSMLDDFTTDCLEINDEIAHIVHVGTRARGTHDRRAETLEGREHVLRGVQGSEGCRQLLVGRDLLIRQGRNTELQDGVDVRKHHLPHGRDASEGCIGTFRVEEGPNVGSVQRH